MHISGEKEYREKGTTCAEAEERACLANSRNRKASVQGKVGHRAEVIAPTGSEGVQGSIESRENFGFTFSKIIWGC